MFKFKSFILFSSWANKRHCREQVKLRFLFIFPGRCPGLLYSGLSARSIAKQLDYLKLDVERSMLDVFDLFVLFLASFATFHPLRLTLLVVARLP